jgi:hypothetical protein
MPELGRDEAKHAEEIARRVFHEEVRKMKEAELVDPVDEVINEPDTEATEDIEPDFKSIPVDDEIDY